MVWIPPAEPDVIPAHVRRFSLSHVLHKIYSIFWFVILLFVTSRSTLTLSEVHLSVHAGEVSAANYFFPLLGMWNFMESFLVHSKRKQSLLFLDFQGPITQGSRWNTQDWSSGTGHLKQSQALGQIGHFLNGLLLFGGFKPETSGQRNFRPETLQQSQDRTASLPSVQQHVQCAGLFFVFSDTVGRARDGTAKVRSLTV